MRKEKAKPKESEAEGEAIQQPKPKKYQRQPKLTWDFFIQIMKENLVLAYEVFL
jgi:hypothetical protein